MTRQCDGGCGRSLSSRNASGRCRSCFWTPINADPAMKERRIAKLRATLAQPEQRARMIETCKVNSRSRLAWCPDAYRERYRHLTRSAMLPASEARAMIEDMIARDARRAIANSHDRLKRGRGFQIGMSAHG